MSPKLARKVWRRGGNWAAFVIAWVSAAAIIGGLESSQQNVDMTKEDMKEMEVRGMAEGLTNIMGFLDEDDELNRSHLARLIQLLGRKDFPRIWALGEDDFEEHIEVLKLKIKLIHEEFNRVHSQLDDDDISGKETVKELLNILQDGKTVDILDKANKMKHVMAEEAAESYSEQWDLGDSLHFVSTVFTTIGYGARYPVTAGGKFATVLMVMTLLPFFLHCLTTSASNINTLLDRILGISENYDDLEDPTQEKMTSNLELRRKVTIKGSLILFCVIIVHLLISAIYHFITTGWGFGDVLYFEFINYSTIGFGDLVPEDEMTVAGAILKNLLVKIPAALILLTLFIRLLPVIS